MSEHEHDPWASLADTLGVTPGGDASAPRPLPPARPAAKPRAPQKRPASAAPAAENWDHIASELGVSGVAEPASPQRPPVQQRPEPRPAAIPEHRHERSERRRDDEVPVAAPQRRDVDRPRGEDDESGARLEAEPRRADRDDDGPRGEDRGPGRRRRRGRRGGRGRGGPRDEARTGGDSGSDAAYREPHAPYGSAEREPRISDDRDRRRDDRQRDNGDRGPAVDDREDRDDDNDAFGAGVSADGGGGAGQAREAASGDRDEDRPRRRRRRGRRGGRGRSRTAEGGTAVDRDRDDAVAARPQVVADDSDDEPLPTGYGGRPPARSGDAPRTERDGEGEPRGRRRRRRGGEGRSRSSREVGTREGGSGRQEGRGRQRRSTESRSGSFSRGRRDDFAPVSGSRDEDDEGLEFLGVEEAGQDMPRRPRHPEDEEILAESGLNTVLDVPSWVEAIGIVIAGNLDARSRSHRGDEPRSPGRRGSAT